MRPVFSAEYLGDSIWSIKKTCPANPLADGSLFYYEDTGKLLGGGFGDVIADDTISSSIINYIMNAYSTTIQVKKFDWRPASVLNLVPKGQESSSETNTSAGLLPSTAFVNTLLVQIDKCHALVVEVLAENPYEGTNVTNNIQDKPSSEKWWQLYYQLQWEISEAEREVEALKLDARMMFDEADSYLTNSGTPENMRYIDAFRISCATYIDRLEQVSMFLEQAREASWKLRCNALISASASN